MDINQFSPYIGTRNPYYMTATPKQNVLPPQQILTANGRDSVNAMQMSPDSSVLIADANLPIIYRCVSDSLGKVEVTEFDISQRQKMPAVDVQSLESRVANIEAIIAQIGENNGKSNSSTGSRQRSRKQQSDVKDSGDNQ